MTGTRAVSDVVAFTLVFSTIILTIGVVTVTGVGTLDDVQAGTESNVAEETMRNYASTLADHRTSSADRRSTTIKLQGHSLELVDSEIRWSVVGQPESDTVSTGALVRTTDTDTQFIYESGGLFRYEDENGVNVRLPPFRCGEDTAHIALTRLQGDFALASDGRVTLESRLEGQEINVATLDDATVSVDVSGTASAKQSAETNAPAWDDTLDGNWKSQSQEDTYECTGTDRLVVHTTTVSVDVVN